MERKFKIFLNDIIENIEIIELFTEDLTFEEFKSDIKTIYAVTRALEIIGEASNQIPLEIREKYSKIEWKQIIGFRNKIIHKYWGVDLEIEWDVITTELDKLKKEIKFILSKL